ARQQGLGDRLGVASRQGPEQRKFEDLVICQRGFALGAEAGAEALPMAMVVGKSGRILVGFTHGMRRQASSQGNHERPVGEFVKISMPSPVTPIVCSNWAESERSRVPAVQPSDSSFTCGRPRLIIGSTVKIIPGLISGPSPGWP